MHGDSMTRSVFLAAVATVLSSIQASGQTPPATPTITEPAPGRTLNPGDVHMEAGPFVDADAGQTHRCTDWEIWTISPSERVWVTSCIGGVERVHTHLADGSFRGSHASRRELFPNRQYMLRVRFRDSSGDAATEWSEYAERTFSTGSLSQSFALETDDIAASPTPTIRDGLQRPIVLPEAGGPARVRIEGPAGQLLLEFLGSDVLTNVITNPGRLSEHVPLRVRFIAGAAGLALPETTISFTTHEGEAVVVYLPSVNVVQGDDVYVWIARSGSTYVGSAMQTEPDFSMLARGNPVPWAALQPGYRVEIVARDFQLPVNIAFVPNPGSSPNSPFYYVTELYGTIKVVTRNGTVSDYATGLLNFNPTGNFPGSGETGLVGVAVDPTNGDVYATTVYSSGSDPDDDNAPHYSKVIRLTSTDGGLTASSQTTILDMVGETQGQSHQISSLSIGPDGNLYVHMGDGFSSAKSQDLSSFRGKILRLNTDGTPAEGNPFLNDANGIGAADYVYASGLRNPFGGAWRESDGSLYLVENGPILDRIAKVVPGRNYLWNGTDASMRNFAIHNWIGSVAPVNMAFVQPGTFGGSGFPAAKQDHFFITESGPTWASGPQSSGKRITEFVLDEAGNLVSGPTPFVRYTGTGKASAVALAAGPDGLYFSDFYKDTDYDSPIDRGSNILRVRFVGAADFTSQRTAGPAPLAVNFTDTSTVVGATAWHWEFGDGTSSTDRNPMHVFERDGIYTVRLSVTSANGLFVQERAGFIRIGAQNGNKPLVARSVRGLRPNRATPVPSKPARPNRR